MTSQPIKLSGVQLQRAVKSAGGVWQAIDLARACGDVNAGEVHRQYFTNLNKQNDDFPRPCAYRVFNHRSSNGIWPMWAGEDVIEWLETHNRFAKAETMIEAVNKLRIHMGIQAHKRS